MKSDLPGQALMDWGEPRANGRGAFTMRCKACHRPLRNPQSMLAGYGRTCAAKAAELIADEAGEPEIEGSQA